MQINASRCRPQIIPAAMNYFRSNKPFYTYLLQLALHWLLSYPGSTENNFELDYYFYFW